MENHTSITYPMLKTLQIRLYMKCEVLHATMVETFESWLVVS